MRTYQCAVVVSVFSLLAPRLFAAEAPQTAVSEVAFSIEAQPLKNALNVWASRTGYQILLPSDGGAVRLMAPKVAGSLSPEGALKQLLAQSGLTYEFVDAHTVAIRVAAGSKTSSNSSILAPEASVHLAQEAGTRSDSTQGTTADSGANTQEPLHEIQVGIPEILVEGSRLLNMDIKRTRDDTQPFVIFDRTVIEQSGAQNIEDFLRSRLTSIDSTFAASQSEGGNSRSSFDLRGLSAGQGAFQSQTLILIDGHRTASVNSGGTPGQPDLNGIPLAAIERIEVLPTTASGIYGGGATGGVINVILRRDYSGLETKLTYGNTLDGGGGERRVDVSAGFNLEGGRTNVMLAGSYSESAELRIGDRDFLQRARASILKNNPGAFFDSPFSIPLGATTNIAAYDPNTFGFTNLTLLDGTPLNSPFTSVPAGYAGTSGDAGAALAANAGHYNLAPANTMQTGGGGRESLLNAPIVASGTLTVRREFTPRVQGFLDLSASKNSSSFAENAVSSQFNIPAGAPGNPFTQDIQVTTPAFGTDRLVTSPYYDNRAVAGVIIKLSDSWKAEADYTWGRTKVSQNHSLGLTTLSDGASTAVSNGDLNIFRDTNVFPVNFASYFTGRPIVTSPATTTLRDATARVSGSLPWALPGGAPTVSLLAEYRKESLGDFVTTNPNFFLGSLITQSYDASQSTKSLYVETGIPWISTRNKLPGIQLLEMTLAARHDRYRITAANSVFSVPGFLDPAPRTQFVDDVSSTDPTFGLRYQPFPDVMLRASYGTGFLPPAMFSLVPGRTISTSGLAAGGLTDPQRGNELIGDISETTGGSPDLKPEKSNSWSAGVIFTPRWVPGLRFSIDWIQIKKHDNINVFGLAQSSIDNEVLTPGIITRGPVAGLSCTPVCPIVGFNAGFVNVAQQKVEAYDLAAEYRVQTAARGTFTFFSAATHNIHNASQLISTAPIFEVVSTAGAVDWKLNAGLNWDYRQWTVNWIARYFDSYFLLPDHTVLLNQGSATVPSQTYHDLSLQYRFGSSFGPTALANTTIQLAVTDVFNTKPPIDMAGFPFYSTLGDPRLATYRLSVTKSF